MKTIKILKSAVIITVAAILFYSCSKDDSGDTLPDNIIVELSDAINFPASGTKKSSPKGIEPLTGEKIYKHLGNFIYLGELSANLVQDMMLSLKRHNIQFATSFSFVSDYDGKEKNVIVKENISINDSITWDFVLTLSDAEMGTAFQLFWNTNPLKATAILQPLAFDFTANRNPNSMMKIEYNENDPVYDKTMIVSITGIDSTSIQSMQKLKFFAGKSGDIVSFIILQIRHGFFRCFYHNFLSLKHKKVINPTRKRLG